MGSILCEHCVAACCRYLALPIDKPTTKRDFGVTAAAIIEANNLTPPYTLFVGQVLTIP